MLEQIGIDREIEKEIIKSLLSDIFKDLSIHYFDLESNEGIEEEDKWDDQSIGFSLLKNESEFPIKIEIYGTPNKNNEEREQYLSKIISDRLNCKTITNYEESGKQNYYTSIIFDNGLAYLANDYNTIFADGEGGKVEVIKEIEYVYS